MNRSWLMVGFATAVHAVWAVMLLWTPTPAGATALYDLNEATGRWGLAAILWFVTILAVVAIITNHKPEFHMHTFLLMLPQQGVLFASLIAEVMAVASAQYGDGTPRQWEFIFTDQWPLILATLMHTYFVVDYGLGGDVSREVERLMPWSRR